RGLDLEGAGVDEREVREQVKAVLVRGAAGALQRRELVAELDAGELAEEDVVGPRELTLADARDDVVHIGQAHRLGHLAGLHLLQRLLGLAGLRLAGIKALALHQAECGALSSAPRMSLVKARSSRCSR